MIDVDTVLDTPVVGGRGGDGGATGPYITGGGGGGGGGAGLVLHGGATLTLTGTLTGGAGGLPGLDTSMFHLSDGGGGGGGAGALVAGATLINRGEIAGGDGTGGRRPELAGTGGAGVVAIGDATVVTSGGIAPGVQAPAGGAPLVSAAVEFFGGGNRLVIEPGARFDGAVIVVAAASPDVLALGGDGAATFDVGQLSALDARSTAPFRGFEAFAKQGAGRWTLTGTALDTAWGVAQHWTVEDGELVANARPAASGPGASGSVTVRSGATLAGTGTAGTVAVAAGGTLAPGADAAPLGTLDVRGDVALPPGAVLAIRSDGSGACAAVAASGTLALGGTLEVRFDGKPMLGASCTIATAANVTGRFAKVIATPSIGIVGYHAQRVTFTVIGDDRLFADDFE
ncbi:MAG: hypothetical protein DI564_05745 [Rhodanobacter denitrificans]|uniref:Uncharacterized protein n=1 Tax=Rhodanobacter denitrificans TaxID=666685 RepID=A0A2W5KRC3_9GAMM|nr:MAG: hypothetical protein DI564_05745 [Rhodanobacter denitrificans]